AGPHPRPASGQICRRVRPGGERTVRQSGPEALMAYDKIRSLIEQQLAEIRAAGLYKTERILLGPQGGSIRVAQGTVINLCANNYLGLADHPAIVEAAA